MAVGLFTLRILSKNPGVYFADPPGLVADASNANELLGWKPEFPELKTIVESAWKWHELNPKGYSE